MRRAAVLLMGPTGAGKSALALELALHLPVEIVSVDSAQIYRGMDIGTAKPDAATRARVPHHLIDIRDAAMSYSAGDFVNDASIAMQDIWSRGRLPLLVGGTMLYFNALTAGIADMPAADIGVRAEIDARAAVVGWPAMHVELARIDPVAAARIHANDSQRIQRAIEVFRLTGAPISQLQPTRRPVLTPAERLELVVAPAERRVLHERLATRFAAMLADGLVGEVRFFYDRGDLTGEHPSMRAVGYRQLWNHLAGECTLERATEQAIAATRQLAKRQLTWLRQRPAATWLDTTQADGAQQALDAIKAGIFAGHAWSGA